LRELEDFVKRYLMVGDRELAFETNGSDVEGTHQTAVLSKTKNSNFLAPPHPGGGNGSDSLKSLVQSVKLEAERNAIAAALEKTGWNRKAAARLLKVSYRTLLYKIEQYQMRSSDSSLFSGGNGFRSKGTGFRGNGRTD
jgi:DNA-binding NtrC family response regulator